MMALMTYVPLFLKKRSVDAGVEAGRGQQRDRVIPLGGGPGSEGRLWASARLTSILNPYFVP